MMTMEHASREYGLPWKSIAAALSLVVLAVVLAFFVGRMSVEFENDAPRETMPEDQNTFVEQSSESPEDVVVKKIALEQFLYVVNHDSDSVSVVDIGKGSEVRRISVGHHPASLAVQGNLLSVANEDDKSMSIIDLLDDVVVKTVSLSGYPASLAVHNGYLYYTDHREGTLKRFLLEHIEDPFGDLHEELIAYVNGARAIVVFNDTLYVVQEESNRIAVIHPQIGKVARYFRVNERPVGIAFSPTGESLYVVHRESKDIALVNLNLGRQTHSVMVEGRPVGIAVHPSGDELVVLNEMNDSVDFYRTSLESRIASIAVGSTPVAVQYTDDGRWIFVASSYVNTVSIIDSSTKTVLREIPVGKKPVAFALVNKIP